MFGLTHLTGFASTGLGADLLSGADGNLTSVATTVYLDAGSIKRYNNLSLTSGSTLIIRGFNETSGVNDGRLPTLIGVAGTFTLDGSSSIVALDNAGHTDNYYEDADYSAPVVPFDAAVSPISYTRFGGYGGYGGESGGWGTIIGQDFFPAGHGGGGSGYTDGGDAEAVSDWGNSGYGADSGTSVGYAPSRYPTIDGFGAPGFVGNGGEVGTGTSVGGGGSGGLRGISGGAVYIQCNIAAVTGTIDIYGQDGGAGGNGGVAHSPDGDAIAGGGGGGGAGGSGGYCWIRYKSGTVAPSINYSGALGGAGGAEGFATGLFPIDGYSGSDGATGIDGGYSIATY